MMPQPHFHENSGYNGLEPTYFEQDTHSDLEGSLLPWSVQESDFPSGAGAFEKLRFLLNYAILAPSSHNSQPWIWKRDGAALRLYSDSRRRLRVSDPNEREMLISCGAALYFLSLAIHYFGCEPEIERFPDSSESTYVARIALGSEQKRHEEDTYLFQAILNRHTYRGIFDNRDMPAYLLKALEEDARNHNVWLKLITERERKEALVDLIAEGSLEQWSDPHFTHEKSQWLRSKSEPSTDGMPTGALGYNELEARLLPTAMRIPLIARMIHLDDLQADRDWMLAGGAPVLAVLGTSPERDSVRDWLAVGEALGKILLRATSAGLAASFFNSPAQVHKLWPRMYKIINCHGFIHLIFRLGYPLEASLPTPRRSVEEVLVPTK